MTWVRVTEVDVGRARRPVAVGAGARVVDSWVTRQRLALRGIAVLVGASVEGSPANGVDYYVDVPADPGETPAGAAQRLVAELQVRGWL